MEIPEILQLLYVVMREGEESQEDSLKIRSVENFPEARL